jgi:hypothetical protein
MEKLSVHSPLLMDKIEQLNQQKHWSEEVLLTEEIWYEHNKPSVRDMAELIGRSKSWVDKSLRLAIGLRINPSLKNHKTRHSAYRFVLKKRKLSK